jgi:hypothetical protein
MGIGVVGLKTDVVRFAPVVIHLQRWWIRGWTWSGCWFWWRRTLAAPDLIAPLSAAPRVSLTDTSVHTRIFVCAPLTPVGGAPTRPHIANSFWTLDENGRIERYFFCASFVVSLRKAQHCW